MELRRVLRYWFFWLGAIFLACLVVPQTGLLVRGQLAALFTPIPWLTTLARDLGIKEGDYADDKDFRRRLARVGTDPGDFQIELAKAIQSEKRIDALTAIGPRFQGNRSYHASILRFMAGGEMAFSRREDAELKSPLSGSLIHEKQPADEILLRFDSAAVAGARLDPGNAYFPAMRSAGFFAAHRDKDAVKELHRAALMSRFDEYLVDEIEGRRKLYEAAGGGSLAFSRAALMAAVSFPHYAMLREMFRLAAHRAGEAERAGRIDEGFSIRADVVRLASLIRDQSTYMIGSQLGAKLTNVAILLPDSITSADEQTGGDKPSDPADRAAYFAYLRSHGRSQDIPWIEREIRAEEEVTRLVEVARHHSPFGLPLVKLIAWWLAGLFLLSNALWMLVLGAAGRLAGRAPEFKGRAASGKSIRQGLIAAPVLAGSLYALFLALSWERFEFNLMPFADAWIALTKIAWLPLTACALVLLHRKSEWARNFRATMFTTAGIFLLASAVYLQCRGGQTLAWFGVDASGPVILCMGWSPPPGMKEMTAFHSAWPFLVVALPVSCLVVFTVVSLVCREPVLNGLVRGFRGLAVPIACFLVACFLLMLPFIVRQDVNVNRIIDEASAHEGKYLAKAAGLAWPNRRIKNPRNSALSLHRAENTVVGDRPCGG